MGFRKKLFLLMAATMVAILILSYASIYYYLYHTTYVAILAQQQATIELNRSMANNFLTSTYHTAVQFVSDQSLGEHLNTRGDNPLDLLRSRMTIQSQFRHYSTHQVIDSTYYYKNTLFISDSIPIASVFESHTLNSNPYATSNSVFSNTNVKNEKWYRDTAKNVTSVFVNEGTQEFCLARKLNNTYYRGAYPPDGTAVMVVSVALNQLDQVFGNIQVTDNSGYAVLDENNHLLFCSNLSIPIATYESALEQHLKTSSHQFSSKLFGEDYLVSYCEVQYGISFLFLTPESNIVDGIMPVMWTYSLIFLAIALITLVVIFFLAGGVSRPLVQLAHAIGSVEDTRNFDCSTLPASQDQEIVTLKRSFKQLIKKNNQLIADVQIQTEREQRSQLKALQAQINPHFIFNAMDMVNWLAQSCEISPG